MARVNPSDRLLEPDAASIPIAHDPGISDEPGSGSRVLGELGDVAVGVWEIAPGTAHDTETDEIFVVLSGRGEVRFEDGETVPLAPGTVVRLREGERTTWVVTETLRKVYVG